MTFRHARSVFVVFSVCGLVACCAHGQTNPSNRPSLQQFYEAVLRNPSAPPSFNDLVSMSDEIGGTCETPCHPMRAEEVKQALPVIFAALASLDVQVKKYAGSALFAISGRSDSASLLSGRLVGR